MEFGSRRPRSAIRRSGVVQDRLVYDKSFRPHVRMRVHMRDLLPSEVAVVVADATAWDGQLLIEEESCLGPAVVAARRAEFAAGRVCARQALRALGVTGIPVPMGPDRRPLWPNGMTGSITHTNSYCAAAVAPVSQVLALGIDAEPHVPLEKQVEELVCTQDERNKIGEPSSGSPHWTTILFSAKESVYKLWSPLAGSWLDFHDVEVELYLTEGIFSARIRPRRWVPTLPAKLQGRFAVDGRLVRTAVALPRHPTPDP